MKTEECGYWFTLSKDVYVSFNSMSQLLLYNTNSGKSLIISQPKCIEIVNDVYKPSNLGVIDLEIINPDHEILQFLDKSIKLGIGLKIEKSVSSNKPINLLPILNLQNDIEKLKNNGEVYLIGEYLAEYLTSINLFINNECKQSCIKCDNYYMQTTSCTRFLKGSSIPIETLEDILSQSASTQVKKINILGGDITLYPRWNTLLTLLNEHLFKFHLWFNLHNISDFDYLINLPFYKEVTVTQPFKRARLEDLISLVEARNDFTFNFIVENEVMLKVINELMIPYNRISYELVPFYNGTNIDFLSNNVFLNESDIPSETIEMRIIFRNQKLNANFFGHLTFLPDGQVKANMNTHAIGYFPDNSILELIYEELTRNTMWRKIRNGGSCSTCMYRYLCPPPGNLEFALGKQNLCHVK